VQPWESGIRVRFGKYSKRINADIHVRVPFFDAVYVQEVRLRVASIPLQTVTTKDGETITIGSAVGYSITDIEKLYKTLYHPETTIQNIVLSYVAEYIFSKTKSDITPDTCQNIVSEAIKSEMEKYGIKIKYIKITGFAIAKTFRLIQDQSWVHEGIDMNQKR
jgi:regulator of protease activity HflC (stomatin/prohibitin superfamily)